MSRERVMHSTLISMSVGKKEVLQQLFISKFGFFALRVDHCVLLLFAKHLNFISFRNSFHFYVNFFLKKF